MKSSKAHGIVGAPIKADHQRREADFYPTPHAVTWALLDYFKFSRRLTVYDPCSGEGDMVLPLEAYGFAEVFASDLRDGPEIVGEKRIDFLMGGYEPSADMVIMNPPFGLASQFIQMATWKYPIVCAVLKSQFWHALTRYPIFMENKPSHVLPLTWRPDFTFKDEEPSGASMMDCIWCCWGLSTGHDTIYQPLLKPTNLPKGLIS